jgi:hypothetical protein
MSDHIVKLTSEGEGMDKRFTPVCSCGWHGRTEHVHNDYCFSNLEEQDIEHVRKMKSLEERNERHYLQSELEDNGLMGGNSEDEE